MIKKLISLVFVSVFLLSVMVDVRAQIVHDVAVVGVTMGALPFGAQAVYPCGFWRVYINVTVENQGTEVENFTVTIYYDGNAIETKNVTNLAPEANTTLAFTWRTRGVKPCTYNYSIPRCGYIPYNISANASIIPGETNTTNNHKDDGTLVVRMTGDANCDGKINVLDLGKFGYRWLSSWWEPKYCWNSDFNGDGTINIIDLGLIAVWWLYEPLPPIIVL